MLHFTSLQKLSKWNCGLSLGVEYIQESELVANNIFLRNMKVPNLF